MQDTRGYHYPLLLLSLLLATALSACKIGHRYERPDLHMPQEYLQQEAMPLGEMDWWEVYADTTLQQLIRQALAYNTRLLNSEARIEEMAARRRVSLAQFFPSIVGSAYSQRLGQNYGGENYSEDPEHGLKLSALWELDLWGGKRWRRDRSRAQWLESIEDHRAMMVSVISDVAASYYQLRALDQELEMVRETLETRSELLEATQLMCNDSLSSQAPYLQAKVEYARTAAYVPALERDIKLIEHEICFLTGQYPDSILRPGTMIAPLQVDTLPSQLSATLLERRPDVRAAEEQLIAANAEMGIANTNRFPSFSLLAIGGLESDELKTLLKSPMHLLLPSVDIPVFNLGKLNAEYKASKYAYKAQVEEYTEAVLAAFREVSDAIVVYGQSKEIRLAAQELCQAAANATETLTAMYLDGHCGYIELLDAQRNYFDAQVSLINAYRDQSLALVALYKSLGGGWQVKPEKPE